ncbi:MAG: His/Gly/Thr/Pro-type tRNA ligase C-terminal domain-containing protein, partial [Pirellulales bacterium]
GIGSICSGGRYDNLAELYTKQQLPGIGASLGLDRLLAAMEELQMIEKIATPAPVFLAYFAEDRLHDYLRLAAQLRAAGIGVEVYPEAKKLGKQLSYADKKGFRYAIVAGSREFDAGEVQLKNLATGEAQQVPIGEVAEKLRAAIEK